MGRSITAPGGLRDQLAATHVLFKVLPARSECSVCVVRMVMMTVILFHQEAFPASRAGLGAHLTSQHGLRVGFMSVYTSASLQAQPSLRATLSAGPLGLRAVPQEPCDHLQPHCPPPHPEPWPHGASGSLAVFCLKLILGTFLHV